MQIHEFSQTSVPTHIHAYSFSQGCPLSPYLFICLMSIMFKDIHTNVEHKLCHWGAPDHMSWLEMIYADDTMLVGRRARELNILIAEIEK